MPLCKFKSKNPTNESEITASSNIPRHGRPLLKSAWSLGRRLAKVPKFPSWCPACPRSLINIKVDLSIKQYIAIFFLRSFAHIHWFDPRPWSHMWWGRSRCKLPGLDLASSAFCKFELYRMSDDECMLVSNFLVFWVSTSYYCMYFWYFTHKITWCES